MARRSSRMATGRAFRSFAVCAIWVIVAASMAGLPSAQAPAAPSAPGPSRDSCRVDGRVRSAGIPLPGVSLLVQSGDSLRAVTSTDTSGSYSLTVPPDSTTHLVADLTAFGRGERDVTLGRPPCDATVDFDLTLRPRRDAQAPPGPDVGQRPQTAPGVRGRGAAA